MSRARRSPRGARADSPDATAVVDPASPPELEPGEEALESPVDEEAGPAPTRRRRSFALSYLVTVFLLVTLNFVLPRAMPGDPLSTLEAFSSNALYGGEADADAKAALVEYYGLGRPVVEQYVAYLGDLARGDLGQSIRYLQPVRGLVAERLPWTLLLVATAMALAMGIGMVAGVHSGWSRGRPVDKGLMVVFLCVRNFPVFFLATLSLFVFSVKLGWFPLAGATEPFVEGSGLVARVADVAHHLALPATVLAVEFAAFQYLTMRAGMVGELGADYLLVGKAKGLREGRLKYRYAARNALLPVVTLSAAQVGFVLSASIFVETVFNYPGIGRLIFEGVRFRDYPVLQGSFLVLALVVLTANLLVDRLYARLDPRTR